MKYLLIFLLFLSCKKETYLIKEYRVLGKSNYDILCLDGNKDTLRYYKQTNFSLFWVATQKTQSFYIKTIKQDTSKSLTTIQILFNNVVVNQLCTKDSVMELKGKY